MIYGRYVNLRSALRFSIRRGYLKLHLVMNAARFRAVYGAGCDADGSRISSSLALPLKRCCDLCMHACEQII